MFLLCLEEGACRTRQHGLSLSVIVNRAGIRAAGMKPFVFEKADPKKLKQKDKK